MNLCRSQFFLTIGVLLFIVTAAWAQEFTRDEIVLRRCGKQYYSAVINEVVDEDTYKVTFIGAEVPETCKSLNDFVKNPPWYRFWARDDIRKMLSTRSYLYKTPLGEHHFHLGETVKVKCSGFDYTEALVVDLTEDGLIAFDFRDQAIQEKCGNVYADISRITNMELHDRRGVVTIYEIMEITPSDNDDADEAEEKSEVKTYELPVDN